MEIEIIQCVDPSKWYYELINKTISCNWIDKFGRAIITRNKNIRRDSRLIIAKEDYKRVENGIRTFKRETCTHDEKRDIFELFYQGVSIEYIHSKYDLKMSTCYALKEEFSKVTYASLGYKNEAYYTDEEEAQKEFCASYEDLSKQEKAIYDSL